MDKQRRHGGILHHARTAHLPPPHVANRHMRPGQFRNRIRRGALRHCSSYVRAHTCTHKHARKHTHIHMRILAEAPWVGAPVQALRGKGGLRVDASLDKNVCFLHVA